MNLYNRPSKHKECSLGRESERVSHSSIILALGLAKPSKKRGSFSYEGSLQNVSCCFCWGKSWWLAQFPVAQPHNQHGIQSILFLQPECVAGPIPSYSREVSNLCSLKTYLVWVSNGRLDQVKIWGRERAWILEILQVQTQPNHTTTDLLWLPSLPDAFCCTKVTMGMSSKHVGGW